MRYTPERNEVKTVGYHFRSVLKSSEKGDIQLVVGDDGRLYVRRYREIPSELFRRLQSVSCPYIERLTERSEDENGAYLISEYIEGTSVSECVFSEREAVRALLELCEAIAALHKAGIIHRDIKPSNIICGADGHMRLIDFDTARLEKTYQSHDTKMLGTAGFAPPEQYGFMQTDSRSDIYSFGVTMEEILGKIADKPKFRRIISRCTQFDPENRYPDIMSVSRAIKRSSHPNCVPYLVVGAVVSAVLLFVFCLNSEPAPQGTGILTNSAEAALDSKSTVEVSEHPTEDILPKDEASAEPVAVEPEQTSEVVAESTEHDENITEEAAQEPPEPTPPTMPQMPKMPFKTTVDENGEYRDEFDYVFYDDPAVHGKWRAYRVLPGDTDIENITGDDIFHADNKYGMLYEFVEIYPDGTLAFYQPLPEHIEPTNVWTNGYYISSPTEGELVCQMKAFTIESGRNFLALEQRRVSVSDDERLHRYIIYSKVDTSDY
ncbi:MAG: serine/threonine protein kinase [Oscillospiraceae bacterium]